MFPQELVDRLVDEVADGIHYPRISNFIPADIQNDLRSCSLAAKCFRLQSQRHLLAFAQLSITCEETPAERVKTLREILETSEAVRHCITYLKIDLHATDTVMNIDDGDVERKFHDENLSSVLNMLTEIRQLTIGHANLSNTIEWDRLSESIRTTFRDTHLTLPHLSSLILTGISISPYDLLYTWKSIKDIALEVVVLNMDEDTSKDVSKLECPWEKLRLASPKFPLPLALQNKQILGGLRQLRMHYFGVCFDSLRQIWNVIHIASKSLEELCLPWCFINSIRPCFLTMDHLPSMQDLRIVDDIIGEKALLDTVYPFFQLVNPKSTSKLENLLLCLTWIMPIGSDSSYEDEVLLPRNGWRQLDALLTSSQYPSLRKVTISICFSASWRLGVEDPQRYTHLWNSLHDVDSSLFPRLHRSGSIELDFDSGIGGHGGTGENATW